jgi:serine/threonine protein kinase, bacterial
MPISTGKILNNRYRIVKLLGQGGFGAVYQAWDLNLHKHWALKENLDTSPEAERQFTREAIILANLSHPSLPRVTDHFSIPGQGHYLVMDFIEGEDLESVLQRQRRVPTDQAIGWITQIADALVYLHSQQPPVLHRDLKPGNIRITPAGQAMLVDFGLVKVYDPSLRTTVGARAVTPGFSPPEQYGQGNTDIRTDIYALGATLYTLLTGQEPPESIQRVGDDQLIPASTVNPQVPAHIGRAIAHAMAIRPSLRYQTISEFKRDITAPKPPPPTPQPPVAPTPNPPSSVARTPSPQPPQAAYKQPPHRRWYRSTLFLVLMFFLFPPIWAILILTGKQYGCFPKLVAILFLLAAAFTFYVYLFQPVGLFPFLQTTTSVFVSTKPALATETTNLAYFTESATATSDEILPVSDGTPDCVIIWTEYRSPSLANKNRSMVWDEIVMNQVGGSGMTALEFYDLVVEHNPILKVDGYVFSEEKTYFLPKCQ